MACRCADRAGPLVRFFETRLGCARPAVGGLRPLVGGTRLGGVRPTFGALPIDEGAFLLQGLYLADVAQLQKGIPPISQALHPDAYGRRRLRYIRRDPREHWATIREIWGQGGGDCEDLAAAVAAELTVRGTPARPVIYRVRPGLAHAVVQVLDSGALLDPSRTGGMGAP